MILNDLTLSTEGDTSGGESLLINFDKVYEDFIKKVLMEYSSVEKFTFGQKKKYMRFVQIRICILKELIYPIFFMIFPKGMANQLPAPFLT